MEKETEMKKLILLLFIIWIGCNVGVDVQSRPAPRTPSVLKAQNIKVYRIESSIYMDRHVTYFEIDGNKFLMTSSGEVIQIQDAQH